MNLPASPVHSPLSRLCRYYLACIGTDGDGVSASLRPASGEIAYTELSELPGPDTDPSHYDQVGPLLKRMQGGQKRYGLYLGYPTYISPPPLTEGEGPRIEPLVLFPIDKPPGSTRWRVDLASPLINRKPFRSFSTLERDMLISELIRLEQELGIDVLAGQKRPDEIAVRLEAIRPDWPWREPAEPARLGTCERPLAMLSEAGIYNRAVMILAEKSPFTRGLEAELRALSAVPETALAGTVLGRWLNGAVGSETPALPDATSLPAPSQRPPASLLHVLTMNAEQGQAVSTALSRPVTIITGPPGTGKSQVVTNMLLNAAWSGKRVLFASKNNRAVDVVETRVNALGQRQSLLRVGGWASFRVRLADHVLHLLSAAPSTDDQAEFSLARSLLDDLVAEKAALSSETQRLIALRNDVAARERAAEGARLRLGDERFAQARALNGRGLGAAMLHLSRAADRADPANRTGFVKRIWPAIGLWRRARLRRCLARTRKLIEAAGIEAPHDDLRPDPGRVRTYLQAVRREAEDILTASHYLEGLEKLQSVRPLEDISRQEIDLADRLALQSGRIWELWLRLQPSRLSAQDRRKLSQYHALLSMMLDAGEEGQLSADARRHYTALLKDVSRLLPCWAVTSLSAEGRIPLEPGLFDIVVFDEASQCDIASALPLLYRAKSVVVIGDPKQLAHISALPKGQDQALLERHDLLPEYSHWAYSYQSLFGLAASQLASHDIVSLADHHRSHPDIITFSNAEFYEGRLRIATRHDSLRMPEPSERGIRWISVPGRVSRPAEGGAVNTREAEAVAQVLRDLVIEKGYQGSLGVVTPFRAQAAAILQAVNNDPALAAALAERHFIADTVHRFQGDERDVMVLSPVVADGLTVGARAFLSSNPNLFNVAITRARAQLIVVGDFDACQGSDIGYLSRFAAYVRSLEERYRAEGAVQIQPGAQDIPDAEQPGPDTAGRQALLQAAHAIGCRLAPRQRIGAYVADFLLVEGERRLVINIDSERENPRWTQEACRRDQIRNQGLLELGYDVIRFWSCELRDALPGCLARLKRWREMKLPAPIAHGPGADPTGDQHALLSCQWAPQPLP